MSERHQIFVIARVGKHYRCLDAVHHDDLYDVKAVSVCLRLIRIYSDDANRLPLELELRLAADFYKDAGPPPQTAPVGLAVGSLAMILKKHHKRHTISPLRGEEVHPSGTALAKLVQVMVSTPPEDIVGLLEEPKHLPDFGCPLRNRLLTVKDDLVASPAAPELLRVAVAGEAFLDWSPFLGLAPETITEALQGPEL
ncbi:hypothetical protein C8A05DRAFT_31953 [Staphylotrichum tortipilum]|uniref:Uncharacterized protein n=1 Tax=Staphylotrichum tortipilum TaxID=2831512 RepID=A0AAN6MQQ8_9PEZI|nr:hypothetical protein C8A05DRAFT_31953 [Staphylotrichum longicolle]